MKKGLIYLEQYCIIDIVLEASWSSGQDVALSRRKHGFDSRTGC